jgi:hypothetical protein
LCWYGIGWGFTLPFFGTVEANTISLGQLSSGSSSIVGQGSNGVASVTWPCLQFLLGREVLDVCGQFVHSVWRGGVIAKAHLALYKLLLQTAAAQASTLKRQVAHGINHRGRGPNVLRTISMSYLHKIPCLHHWTCASIRDPSCTILGQHPTSRLKSRDLTWAENMNHETRILCCQSSSAPSLIPLLIFNV